MWKVLTIVLLIVVHAVARPAFAADCGEKKCNNAWKIGTPIVTYWPGPQPVTEEFARQLAEGGWNLAWCNEKELDVAERHGLRAQLLTGLLTPKQFVEADNRKRLGELIARVRNHPALYSYHLSDEPSTRSFLVLGKLVTYLRERDPDHPSYINLLPTYAPNEMLGTKGDRVTAYGEHLRQYMEIVKPSLLSYDHYQFTDFGDRDDYFLNLAMIRRAALDAGIPFLNIVQASSWHPSIRVPKPNEMQFLVYTTLAYGAQGIAHYVYCAPGHDGGMATSDGKLTPLYHVMKKLNQEFVAIATELQPLKSLAVYHTGMTPPMTEPLPANAPFCFHPPMRPMDYTKNERVRGALLGYFGKEKEPSHVVVVNMDYEDEAVLSLVGPVYVGKLEIFDATTRTWTPTASPRAELRLPPGGGKLVRVLR